MLSLDSEEYLTWLGVERGRAANTLAAYRRDLAGYERWLADQGLQLDAVTEAAVERYVAHLRLLGKAPSSVARALVAVRSLHRFLLEEGRLDLDPTGHVGAPPVPLGVPRALTEEEVASLLDAVGGASPKELRDRAILELLYSTGMRISELTSLSLGDLRLDEGTLRAAGAGARQRVVPIGRDLASAMRAWLAPGGRADMAPERWTRKDDAEAVFLNTRGGRLSRQGAWGVVRAYGERVGLGARLTPHVLRHSCATHMLEHGADLRVVQQLLGNSSVAAPPLPADRLRAGYDAAHPRAGAGNLASP